MEYLKEELIYEKHHFISEELIRDIKHLDEITLLENKKVYLFIKRELYNNISIFLKKMYNPKFGRKIIDIKSVFIKEIFTIHEKNMELNNIIDIFSEKEPIMKYIVFLEIPSDFKMEFFKNHYIYPKIGSLLIIPNNWCFHFKIHNGEKYRVISGFIYL